MPQRLSQFTAKENYRYMKCPPYTECPDWGCMDRAYLLTIGFVAVQGRCEELRLLNFILVSDSSLKCAEPVISTSMQEHEAPVLRACTIAMKTTRCNHTMRHTRILSPIGPWLLSVEWIVDAEDHDDDPKTGQWHPSVKIRRMVDGLDTDTKASTIHLWRQYAV